MLHIYTGNGKGKTTAAVGLTVRASGAGKKICFMQFLKNGTSSEISQLKKLGIDVICAERCSKFTYAMTPAELESLTAEHNSMIEYARKLVLNDNIGLLVLDEFIGAYTKKLLDTGAAGALLEIAAKSGCEVVLTGRNAPDELLAIADYITEMKPLRHPYDKGIPAREGIEY